MTTPANIPSQIGAPGGAPSDILGIVMYLSQFVQALNTWVAKAANAINWLLSQTMGRAHAINSTATSLGFSTTSTTPVSTGFTTRIIPKFSGTILCLAQIQTDIATNAYFIDIWYGTGTAPAANAAMSGTPVLALVNSTQSVVGAVNTNIASPVVGAVFGLTVGTSYWFTVGGWVNTGTGTTNAIALTLVEI